MGIKPSGTRPGGGDQALHFVHSPLLHLHAQGLDACLLGFQLLNEDADVNKQRSVGEEAIVKVTMIHIGHGCCVVHALGGEFADPTTIPTSFDMTGRSDCDGI